MPGRAERVALERAGRHVTGCVTLQMPNRTLTETELVLAWRLIESIRTRLDELSEGDPEVLFAYRRKVARQLSYDERSSPSERKRLKVLKRREQNGLCTICGEPLPETRCVLDRLQASAGYTAENTRLIHPVCDAETQSERGYA